jgi:hypothetical protein
LESARSRNERKTGVNLEKGPLWSEKAGICAKTWSEVKRLSSKRSQMEMLYKCPKFLMI